MIVVFVGLVVDDRIKVGLVETSGRTRDCGDMRECVRTLDCGCISGEQLLQCRSLHAVQNGRIDIPACYGRGTAAEAMDDHLFLAWIAIYGSVVPGVPGVWWIMLLVRPCV